MVRAAMTNQPFFTRDRDAFIPTDGRARPVGSEFAARPRHHRPSGFAIEQRHGGDDFVPARLTVDMFRLPTLAPIEVKTRLVRDGLRIKVVEAEFFSGGVSDGARVLPVAAQNRKPARQGVVAAELECA